jgi:hypothetical protein
MLPYAERTTFTAGKAALTTQLETNTLFLSTLFYS